MPHTRSPALWVLPTPHGAAAERRTTGSLSSHFPERDRAPREDAACPVFPGGEPVPRCQPQPCSPPGRLLSPPGCGSGGFRIEGTVCALQTVTMRSPQNPLHTRALVL